MGNQIVSEDLMDMGDRVREYRTRRHWSQEKLAEEADISLNTVSRIEGGQTRMSIEVFKRLVQALGINMELLLFGEISDKERQDCARIQFMLQKLEDGDKEILLETMGTLAESLQKYK